MKRLGENLSQSQSVAGVVLLGSLAIGRRFDAASDLDIGVFVDDLSAERPEGIFSLPFSFFVTVQGEPLEVNLTHVLLSSAQSQPWSVPQLEAFSNGRVLFDRSGAVAEIIRAQVGSFSWVDALADRLNRVFWRGIVHSERAFNRGSASSACLLLAEAFHDAIEALYFLNFQFPPHTKWLCQSLESLTLRPPNAAEYIDAVQRIAATRASDLSSTRSILTTLHDWTVNEATRSFPSFPVDIYHHWASRLSGRQLLPETFAEHIAALAAIEVGATAASEVMNWLAFHAIGSKADLRALAWRALSRRDPFVLLSPVASAFLRDLVAASSDSRWRDDLPPTRP